MDEYFSQNIGFNEFTDNVAKFSKLLSDLIYNLPKPTRNYYEMRKSKSVKQNKSLKIAVTLKE